MSQNARILAYKIKEIADINLVARPFNRFNTDKTIWWLIPSNEWPAYKYGKIFCDLQKDPNFPQKEKLYCGFYIEKGLGEITRNIFRSSLIMDNSWLWSDFCEDCQSYQISPSLFQDKILTVQIAYIPPEKGRDISQPEDLDLIKKNFQVIRSTFACTRECKLKPLGKRMNPVYNHKFNLDKNIVHSEKIPDLLTNIKKIPDIDWLWVDLYIGKFVPVDLTDISLTDLWKKELAPWKPWLRKVK